MNIKSEQHQANEAPYKSTTGSDRKSPPDVPWTNKTTQLMGMDQRTHAKIVKDYKPSKEVLSPHRMVDALLKHPFQVVYEIIQGNRPLTLLSLLLIVIITMFGYGIMMGAFSGGNQLWVVPLKVVVGTIASALICLPSLYIFTCLCGGRQTFAEVTNLLALSLALAGILLAGFAPITWIFSQSTNAIIFMGIMHIAFWTIGVCLGFRLLDKAFAFLNRENMGMLKIWIVVFVVVVMQMCTTLRPLIGPYKPLSFAEKKFFLAHWEESLFGRQKHQ